MQPLGRALARGERASAPAQRTISPSASQLRDALCTGYPHHQGTAAMLRSHQEDTRAMFWNAVPSGASSALIGPLTYSTSC